MKVSVSNPKKWVDVTTMKVGQLAQATFGGEECVILRTFSGWVSLSDPNNTWSLSSIVEFNVKILPIGTTITIVADE